jgi:hypothetical protein
MRSDGDPLEFGMVRVHSRSAHPRGLAGSIKRRAQAPEHWNMRAIWMEVPL